MYFETNANDLLKKSRAPSIFQSEDDELQLLL